LTANIQEKAQLKKELYTFLLVTFVIINMIDFVIYMISGPLSYVATKLWTVRLVAVAK